MIDLVLATDMKQHFTILTHFNTVHRLSTNTSVTPSLASGHEGSLRSRRRSSSNTSSVISLAQNDADKVRPRAAAKIISCC